MTSPSHPVLSASTASAPPSRDAVHTTTLRGHSDSVLPTQKTYLSLNWLRVSGIHLDESSIHQNSPISKLKESVSYFSNLSFHNHQFLSSHHQRQGPPHLNPLNLPIDASIPWPPP